MGLIASGTTDIGKKRKSNQDSFKIEPELKFYIVADGMGGHNGGDIASQMATKIIPEFILKNFEMEPVLLLKSAIKEANKAIKDFGESQPELSGMGTTVVCFLFKGQNLYIANIGDSRGYLINKKKIYQLTSDHSLVQEKLNQGIYAREQAALDPQNVLVKTVGFEDDVVPDIFTYKVNRNDIFICCSDGLHGKVNDEDILYLVNKYIPNPEDASKGNTEEAIKELVDLALLNGGQDNITVIVILAQ